MPLLELNSIAKTFNHDPALSDVSLTIEEGTILCLLGPSGCGKTTLLRIIAGLERPDAGKVFFANRDMAHVAPYKRNFGMMFQEFALFPHLNVRENISFGMKMQGRPPAEIMERTREMLFLVGLEEFAQRGVSELSGGERQRVALARTLAPRPRLVLLDEPFGALDRALRERLLLEVRNILKRLGVTTVFVTHDQAEAYAVADIIAVMEKGRIEQRETPENLYAHPANERVARFLGFSNIMDGIVLPEGTIRTDIGVLHHVDHDFLPGAGVRVLVRPDAARIPNEGEEPGERETIVKGAVKSCLFRGRNYHLELLSGTGQVLAFELSNESRPSPAGSSLEIALSPSAVVIMPHA